MARQKWTLALIIICLPILATVIAAFRVRDLPKSLQDGLKTELKKHKCDNCDVNEVKVGHKLHSDKSESAKHKYEELKKAVREKQQVISLKSTHNIQNAKILDDRVDEDNEEDDLKITKSKSFLKERHYKVPHDQGLKKDSTKKIKNIEEDDDDDENNNGKEILVKTQKFSKIASQISKQNVGLKSNKLLDKVNDNDNNDYDDDDEDDDDDDDDDNDNDDDDIDENNDKVQKPSTKDELKKSDTESKEKTKLNKQTDIKLYVSKEEDDNNDKYGESNKLRKNIINKKESKSKTKEKNKRVQRKSISISLDEDDDDDDEEDDDDDDDRNDPKISPKSTSKESSVSKAAEKASSTGHQDYALNDDGDDNDSSGIFSSLFKKAQNLILIDAPQETPLSELKREKKIASKDQEIPQLQKTKLSSKTEPEKKDAKSRPENKLDESVKVKPEAREKKSSEPSKNIADSIKDEKKDKKEKKSTDKTESEHKESEKRVVKQKTLEQKEHKQKQHEKPKKEMKPAETKEDSKSKTEHRKDEQSKESTETLMESKEILERHEKYLKTINAALQRRNLLQSEFEDFYAFFPTFAPNFSRILNPECRRHGQILLRQLRGTKLWALNMLDATAKIPSGILQGNGIQLGDFDQCLGSRARVQLDTGSVVKVQGQYCLARVDLRAEHPELEVPVHLAQAKNLVKSRIDDPGHFVPRFSTLSWGVCLPSACDPEDVEVVIKDALKHYQHTAGLAIKVKVDEEDCHTQDGDWLDEWSELPTILTLSFYGVIVLLVLIATVQDFLSRGKSDEVTTEGVDENAECDQKEAKDEEETSTDDTKQTNGFLSQFSLYRTVSKLVEPCSSDEISCIHGVRAVATVALLVAHKFLPIGVMPYTNRLRITETVSSPVWSWCRAGWMYTDCFLLLSGTLTAHRMASDTDTGAPRRLFSRYLRLSPALLAVVLFYAYVWDKLSTGPMWGTLVTKNAEVCQEGWWWNMLYVQNYFGFEEMCAPQTHQLALDFQLTIIGGIIVWAMQVKERLSWFLMPALHAIAAYSRYSTVQEHRLTLIAYHGVTVSQLYRTARLSYTSVLHRSTPYLVGLSLGIALQKPSDHGKIITAVGWLSSGALWGLVWYAGYDSGSITYRYNAAYAAQYAALAPLASALAIAWVIYAVHSGSFESLSRLLSCRFLVLISRLSYALYLCQFIVFLTQAATVRSSTEFTLLSLIDVQEISTILLSSIILTLSFVIPMQSLHKLFISLSKKDSGEGDKGETEEELGQKVEEEPKDDNIKIEEIEVPQIKSRHHFLAHREVLEEIPEAEVEFELQRDRLEGLEEILEEEEAEENEPGEDEAENQIDDEDLEIIEEEQGEDDFWGDREEYNPRSMYSRQGNRDSDEWEWTSDGNGRSGARYSR